MLTPTNLNLNQVTDEPEGAGAECWRQSSVPLVLRMTVVAGGGGVGGGGVSGGGVGGSGGSRAEPYGGVERTMKTHSPAQTAQSMLVDSTEEASSTTPPPPPSTLTNTTTIISTTTSTSLGHYRHLLFSHLYLLPPSSGHKEHHTGYEGRSVRLG
jgi:hypothetical protein